MATPPSPFGQPQASKFHSSTLLEELVVEEEPDPLRTLTLHQTSSPPFRRPSRKRRRAQNRFTTNNPDSFFYYDTLAAHPSSATRRVTDPRSSIVYYPDSNVRLMKLSTLIGYTRQGHSVVSPNLYATKGLLMGMHHFNTRNATLIQNLDSLTRTCNLRMTMDVYDTERTASTGSRVLTQYVHTRNDTMAVIGAVRSAVSIPLAVLNAARSIPTISYVSTSSILDNRDQYSLFGRTVPSNDGDSQAVLQYYASLNVTHLGILYVRDDYGTAYRLSLEAAAQKRNITTSSSAIVWDAQQSREAVIAAIGTLEQTGFRYFIGVVFSNQLGLVVDEAIETGIMGPGYHWLFADGIHSNNLEALRFPQSSKKAKSIHGLGLILPGTSGAYADRFLEAWDAFDRMDEFGAFYESKSPLHTDAVQFEHNFTFPDPGQSPQRAYDAVMALGIAGCQLEDDFFTGQELFDEFLRVDFDGASGPILIDSSTGSRFFNTSGYVIENGVLTEPNEDGMVSLRTYVAAEYSLGEKGQGSWKNLPGVQYNYSDMTSVPPLPLPELEEELNPYGPVLYGVFFVLSTIVMLSAVGFAFWTWWWRKSHVIRASQPGFLILICVGVFLMAFALIPHGSESPPFSYEFANASCMITYWCFISGFGLAFSSLLAKLWRINKLLSTENQFRRVTVGAKDVMVPLTFTFVVNTVILSLWQILTPVKYVRSHELYDSFDQFGRRNESDSRCESEEGEEMYFLLALFLVNGAAIVAANVQAFRARNISTEFSESKYIAIAMVVILQATLISLPVFFYKTNTKANYLAKSFVMLVVGSSILYLIFVPKIGFWRLHEKKMQAREERRRERQKAKKVSSDASPLERVMEHENESCSSRHLEVDDDEDEEEENASVVGLKVVRLSKAKINRNEDVSVRRSCQDRSSGVRVLSNVLSHGLDASFSIGNVIQVDNPERSSDLSSVFSAQVPGSQQEYGSSRSMSIEL